MFSSQYLSDLSRVRLELSDLYPEPNGSVTVERSANASMVPADTVRGAVTLPLICPDGLSLDGSSGNYASTPDAASLDITGDIDIRADVTLDNWTSGVQRIVAKWGATGDQRSYSIFINSDGEFRIQWSEDGIGSLSFGAVAVTPGSGGRLAVRGTLDVDDGSGNRVATVYTAPSIEGPWTVLDTGTFAGTTSIFAGTAELEIGSEDGGTVNLVSGTIHAAEVYDGIDGTVAADPYFANETAGATSFSDSSGNTWTANGSAEIVRGVWARVDDYEFYADVENFYRAIRVEPTPGLFLGGVDGDYASTPDDASLDITGDLDLRVDLTRDDWTPDIEELLISKYDVTGDNRQYLFRLTTTGSLLLTWSEDGTSATLMSEESSVSVTPGSDGRLAVRVTLHVDNGSGGYTVRFYSAPSIAGPWTALGSAQVGNTTTSIYGGGNQPLEVGAFDSGAQGPMAGTIHAAEVRDGINGTAASDPDFAAEASQTSMFTDDAGRTWTVQGNAVIWGETLDGANTTSITPDLEGVTWLKSVTYPALNRPLGEAPEYRPVQRSSRTGVFNTKGRVPPTAVYDAWTSRWWTMEFVTETLEAARDMDLVLATSRTLFIHAPAESANDCFTNPVSGMPGGYVMAQNATMSHAVGGSHVMQWVLPVRQVAPPVPEVSGGTVTFNTLMRLYGSWTALWAAYSDWTEVWATIGDPEDAINP